MINEIFLILQKKYDENTQLPYLYILCIYDFFCTTGHGSHCIT